MSLNEKENYVYLCPLKNRETEKNIVLTSSITFNKVIGYKKQIRRIISDKNKKWQNQKQ